MEKQAPLVDVHKHLEGWHCSQFHSCWLQPSHSIPDQFPKLLIPLVTWTCGKIGSINTGNIWPRISSICPGHWNHPGHMDWPQWPTHRNSGCHNHYQCLVVSDSLTSSICSPSPSQQSCQSTNSCYSESTASFLKTFKFTLINIPSGNHSHKHKYTNLHIKQQRKHLASSLMSSHPHQTTNRSMHKNTPTHKWACKHMHRHKDHTRLLLPGSGLHVLADEQVSWLFVCSSCAQVIRNKEIPWAVPVLIGSMFKQALGHFPWIS